MRKQSYTVQEVARLVEFSDQTVREWAKTGRIKTVRPGGIRAYRIPRAEVERLLAEFQIDDRVLDTAEYGARDSDVQSPDTKMNRLATQPSLQ
jgi:excisionase family DNA binding protein